MGLYEIIILSTMEIISTSLIIVKIDNRIREKKSKIIALIAFSVIFSFVFNNFNLPMRAVTVAIYEIILLKILFQINFVAAIFDYFTAFIFVYIFQVFVMLVMQLLKVNINENIFINGVIMSIGVLIISLVVYKYVPINKITDMYIKEDMLVNFISIIIIFPFMIHSFIWDSSITEGLGYLPLILSGIIIWTLLVIIVFYEIIKIRENKKVIEIYNEYNPLLQNLMNELKGKQHDIRNHLHAIYGIAEHEGNDEIKDYIDNLVQSFSEKDKLINTGNIIISSLIYSKSNIANSKNIDFKFNYEKPIPVYPLKDYEITEVIGNIIDNAIEATESVDKKDKKIVINMKNEEELKVIEVQNTGVLLNNIEKNKFFKIGFSTKGKKRGYGLYNVQKIVKSYKGFIEISHNNGITTFKLMFP
ncbi:hypothetical protein SH2C18_44730 [Clostridium sediminicola]|uniref:sensor histidine kinase n=1 Tax=Clostridium sediminicola TaxID=3114879 RepID=UPI0031F20359